MRRLHPSRETAKLSQDQRQRGQSWALHGSDRISVRHTRKHCALQLLPLQGCDRLSGLLPWGIGQDDRARRPPCHRNPRHRHACTLASAKVHGIPFQIHIQDQTLRKLLFADLTANACIPHEILNRSQPATIIVALNTSGSPDLPRLVGVSSCCVSVPRARHPASAARTSAGSGCSPQAAPSSRRLPTATKRPSSSAVMP